jgi:rRNA maturation endonuclease Nob1
MPYDWTCETCRVAFYSAARNPGDETCPRCGGTLKLETTDRRFVERRRSRRRAAPRVLNGSKPPV